LSWLSEIWYVSLSWHCKIDILDNLLVGASFLMLNKFVRTFKKVLNFIHYFFSYFIHSVKFEFISFLFQDNLYIQSFSSDDLRKTGENVQVILRYNGILRFTFTIDISLLQFGSKIYNIYLRSVL